MKRKTCPKCGFVILSHICPNKEVRNGYGFVGDPTCRLTRLHYHYYCIKVTTKDVKTGKIVEIGCGHKWKG